MKIGKRAGRNYALDESKRGSESTRRNIRPTTCPDGGKLHLTTEGDQRMGNQLGQSLALIFFHRLDADLQSIPDQNGRKGPTDGHLLCLPSYLAGGQNAVSQPSILCPCISVAPKETRGHGPRDPVKKVTIDEDHSSLKAIEYHTR